MATPRRPSRPARPSSASARRRPPQDEEPIEGEEGEFEEEEAAPPPPISPTMMVGLGAALLFAILMGMWMSSRRGFLVEVENLSQDMIQNVVVKINGERLELGDLRSNEIGGSQAHKSPGRDVEVEYKIPNRGTVTKKVTSPIDFVDNTQRYRILLAPEGITEIEYAER
jgi:hypothetical protein